MFRGQAINRVRWLVAELTVIVLGILIAFQLEEWRDERRNREEEKVVLFSIVRDLEIEREEYALFRDRIDRNRDIWLKMIALLRSPEEHTEEQIISNFGRYNVRGWTTTNAAFLGLSQSGKLGIVSDPRLQTELVKYYEVTQPTFKTGSEFHLSLVSEYVRILTEDVEFVIDDNFADTNEYRYKLLVAPDQFPSYPSMMRLLVNLDRSYIGATEAMDHNLSILEELTKSISSHVDSL
ncbi:MAG: hypothetical protein R3F41_14245 [Gammaproteobacteria bacterium]|nr:hypothetical protein [Pseudomonadales bacterium]